MEPFMSINEKTMFRKYLSNSKNYFEFGSGGSTVWACNQNNIESITTVENDPVYIEKVKVAAPRATIFEIDMGVLTEGGHPVDRTNIKEWKLYWETWNKKPIEPDLVLVDGRFRVCCALTVALSCNPHTRILFHDFTIRPYYHCILLFFDIIEQKESLVVLRVKPDIHKGDIETIIKLFIYDSR